VVVANTAVWAAAITDISYMSSVLTDVTGHPVPDDCSSENCSVDECNERGARRPVRLYQRQTIAASGWGQRRWRLERIPLELESLGEVAFQRQQFSPRF